MKSLEIEKTPKNKPNLKEYKTQKADNLDLVNLKFEKIAESSIILANL